ncbi:MAG: hypothetical protein LBJ08_07705 [Bifidobacteriaceae bacterium]|jgi:hypothetical protein|nr:hypothetical protein [Bifidobacteriaceae bacterium]
MKLSPIAAVATATLLTASLAGAPSVASPLAPVAAKSKAALTVELIGATQYAGTTNSHIYAAVTVKKKAASGKIRIAEGKKTLKTVKLKKGAAVVALPKSLQDGAHKLTVTYLPAKATKVASAKKSVNLTVATPTPDQVAVMTTPYCSAILTGFPKMALGLGDIVPTSAQVAAAVRAANTVAAVAPNSDTAVLWNFVGDLIRVSAGTLSDSALFELYPQAVTDPNFLETFFAFLDKDATDCGLAIVDGA